MNKRILLAEEMNVKYQNKSLWRLLLFTLGIGLLFCALKNASPQTAPQIAEKVLAATVSLNMQDKNGVTLGRGSGFFVQYNLIATNYHVIEGAAQGTAKLIGEDTTYVLEEIIATDKTNDLALLKVTIQGLRPLSLGDSDMVRIGETVYVAGNPHGFEGTFSNGIISGRRDSETRNRLQMTAPISPGSSGGPVLNGKGEVIGVSVATYRGLYSQNLNFAIPSNHLKILLTQSGMTKSLSQQSPFISAETYILRGREKYEEGDPRGAIADFDAAIRIKPKDANAYFMRGFVKHHTLEQYSAAIADFSTGIRIEPKDANAYYNRGIAKMQLGQHYAAIADYDTAIRLKPDDADAYYSRGIARYFLGQYSAAIADYDTAIRLKPDYANAILHAGICKRSIRTTLRRCR